MHPEVSDVGILGGAFNPPHPGHQQLAQAALRELALSQLLFIPTSLPPHKRIEGNLTFAERAFLIGVDAYILKPADVSGFLAPYKKDDQARTFVALYEDNFPARHNPRMGISLIEQERQTPSYTIDSAKRLLSENRSWKIHIIVGADQAAVFDSWRDWQELSRIAVICAAERPGYDRALIESRFPFMRFFPFTKTDLSSSMARARIENGETLDGVLSREVRDILKIIRPTRNQ
jgi:nicotinate-nucleotide adenylyltransferase